MGGVSANQALNDAALAWQADALVVHHGFFWGNEPRTIVKLRANRIGALMRADMSLFAFHLPLDAHRVVGNNAGLATALGAPVSAETPRLGWPQPGSASSSRWPRRCRSVFRTAPERRLQDAPDSIWGDMSRGPSRRSAPRVMRCLH